MKLRLKDNIVFIFKTGFEEQSDIIESITLNNNGYIGEIKAVDLVTEEKTNEVFSRFAHSTVMPAKQFPDFEGEHAIPLNYGYFLVIGEDYIRCANEDEQQTNHSHYWQSNEFVEEPEIILSVISGLILNHS